MRYWNDERENRQKRKRSSFDEQANNDPGQEPLTVMEQDHPSQNAGAIDFTKMTTDTSREELKYRNAKGFSRKKRLN